MLRAIHDLDIQDKHRTLVLLGGTRTFEFDRVYDLDDPTNHSVTVRKHDIYYIFPEDGPLGGKPVIETLKVLWSLLTASSKRSRAWSRSDPSNLKLALPCCKDIRNILTYVKYISANIIKD